MRLIRQSFRAIKRIILMVFYDCNSREDIRLKIARELIIFPYFQRVYTKIFRKRYLKGDEWNKYFDFKGAKLPDISTLKEMRELAAVFEDVLLIPCMFNDNYDKNIVDKVDRYTKEGPYGYKDGDFDVSIKKGDVVMDVGAWIGDFSAYASSKGAITYAFEPTQDLYDLLCETKRLNEQYGGGEIYITQKALGSQNGEISISIEKHSSGANSISMNRGGDSQKVVVVRLDDFVTENNIEKVDFIKADIEGAERELLKGAMSVMKTFSPKLAICTYHLPDDPEVLANIIKEANPNYKIVQMRHKLFAAVV